MKRKNEQIISEIIGSNIAFEVYNNLWRFASRPTYDARVTDYEFWDKFRRGAQPGYEFGCLFANPMAQIVAAYTLGEGIELALDGDTEASDKQIEETNRLLAVFAKYLNALLLTFVEDLYGLADGYMVLNPDGSISIPSPDTVDVKYSEEQYRKIEKVTITTLQKGRTTKEVFTTESRTITVTERVMSTDMRTETNRVVGEPEVYPNLIGKIPVVHFPNDRGVNETHGRVLYEALLPLFARYDDLVTKGSDGAELLGNPIPTITGLEDATSVQSDNAPIDTETYTDQDGNTETRKTLNIDNRAIMLLGAGADFKMVAAQTGFTNDVRAMLKMLFLLILDHARIPEYVWGGAIASSRASAETQAPPFYTYINRRRNLLEGVPSIPELGIEAFGGLLEVADIFLRYQSLINPNVIVAPVVSQFSKLGDIDSEVKRKWTEMLRKDGAISAGRMLALSGLIDDPEAALQEVQDEIEESGENDNFNAMLDDAIQNALKQPVKVPTGQNVE